MTATAMLMKEIETLPEESVVEVVSINKIRTIKADWNG